MIRRRTRAVLTNYTIHIFLPDAARRYVFVCFFSNADSSRRTTRRMAHSIAMKAVIPRTAD